ncbi:hypothetical protein FQ775_22125 [Nitratireductor mangrovi]|uniref:Uncharacterized protein n=1 Tax=Nitratireductor mangrovi TaxID=2599600 RepID=A0A5B8L4W6_9HYPH|nr:hypothetical protein [Nitratireductor mangrovi]QDZ02849.1 hypothetical protein FQ775_22125 [Nitratireductor mangrovi]
MRFAWHAMRIGCVLALAVAGCAQLPKFQERDYIKVEALFYTVEQELCEALAELKTEPRISERLREAGITVESQYAKVTAGLKLERILDTGGNASLVIPVDYGTAGLGLGAMRSHVNTVDTTVSVYYPFTELACSGEIPSPPERIAGGLGLREWILQTTVSLINVRETPAAYSYEISFAVITDKRARPSITLSTSNFSLIGGDLSLGAARELTHTLSVTIRDIALNEPAGTGGAGVPDVVRDALDREESLTILRRIRD